MSYTLSPLTTSSRADACYRTIKNAILTLELAPGTPLVEINIAEQLAISKTPVREALRRLRAEGLVESRAGAISQVAPLTESTIRGIYRTRIIIESGAIYQIADQLVDEQIEELEDIFSLTIHAMEGTGADRWVATNDQFHSRLIQFHQNESLERIARGLSDQADRVRAAVFATEKLEGSSQLLEVGIQRHRDVVKALKHRDKAAAAAAMEADIQSFFDLVDTPAFQSALNRLVWQQ